MINKLLNNSPYSGGELPWTIVAARDRTSRGDSVASIIKASIMINNVTFVEYTIMTKI